MPEVRQWQRHFEQMTPAQRGEMRHAIETMRDDPLMAQWQPEYKVLAEIMDSTGQQAEGGPTKLERAPALFFTNAQTVMLNLEDRTVPVVKTVCQVEIRELFHRAFCCVGKEDRVCFTCGGFLVCKILRKERGIWHS